MWPRRRRIRNDLLVQASQPSASHSIQGHSLTNHNQGGYRVSTASTKYTATTQQLCFPVWRLHLWNSDWWPLHVDAIWIEQGHWRKVGRRRWIQSGADGGVIWITSAFQVISLPATTDNPVCIFEPERRAWPQPETSCAWQSEFHRFQITSSLTRKSTQMFRLCLQIRHLGQRRKDSESKSKRGLKKQLQRLLQKFKLISLFRKPPKFKAGGWDEEADGYLS